MPQAGNLPKIRYVLGKMVGRVTSVVHDKTVRVCSLLVAQHKRAHMGGGATLSCSQAVVQVPRFHRDPKIGKDVSRRTKLWAHDEFNLCSLGDIVRLEPSRALSKKKAHIIAEIVTKEDGTPPPSPFPSM